MADFNGRIGEIARVLKRTPADLAEARYVIRNVLRAERMDGWKEGYSDGREDYAESALARRDAAREPVQYAWTGTSPRGEDTSGAWRMAPAHLAAVVEDRFELGWRALSVTAGGSDVAGIEPHPDKPGELRWWTEDDRG